MKSPVLLDAYGRPIQRQALTQEVASATYGGVRSPLTGYPGDGLTPILETPEPADDAALNEPEA